ncbi:MAG: hypothetical protein WAO95_15540 [Burkholderiales bacterium]
MRLLVAFLTAILLLPALAQPPHGGRHDGAQRPMPPPQRRMDWEERQRMREQVRSGQMSREEARERWHEHRRNDPARFSPEQREELRRAVREANRDLEKR